MLGDAPAALAEEGWERFELLSTERALVALGGGRVIDAAKAAAAVRGGEVAALPTTLSGAEMTAIHRLPNGHEGASGVRPSLVLADPVAMESLPERRLRATAINALAHGADSLYTPLADEHSRSAALRGARLIAAALDAEPEWRERAPERTAELAGALGCEPAGVRERIEQLAGGQRRLGELGAERSCLEPALDTALARPDLAAMTPGEVSRQDVGATATRAHACIAVTAVIAAITTMFSGSPALR